MKYKWIRWIFLMAGIIGITSACAPRTNQSSDEIPLLIGTYTNGNSEGIYSFRFNQETGKAIILDSIQADNPSFLIASADGTRVYAVSESNDSTDGVSAYAFDKEKGTLKWLNKQLTGKAPCHISTNGQILLTSNYEGGSLSLFPIEKDGSLGADRKEYKGSAHGVDSLRQATPHVHCSLFLPDGKRVIATDFSADRLLCFDLEGDSLQLRDSIAIEPGSGPRHLALSPDKTCLYLIEELGGNVRVYAYENGHLQAIQTIEADEVHARGSADIHLSPDGRFLYTSHRLKNDGIAIFSVKQTDGTLMKIGYQPTGKHPRHFNLTPNGKYLLVACRDDNTVQIFERDAMSGLLRDTGKAIQVPHAVCVQFIP